MGVASRSGRERAQYRRKSNLPRLADKVKHWRGVSGESAPNRAPMLDLYLLVRPLIRQPNKLNHFLPPRRRGPKFCATARIDLGPRLRGESSNFHVDSLPSRANRVRSKCVIGEFTTFPAQFRPLCDTFRNESFHRPRIGLHHFKFLRLRFNPLVARRTRRLSAESFQHALFEFCR